MSKVCGKLDEAGTALDSGGTYPVKLNKIIHLFESLPEDERRETLVSYSIWLMYAKMRNVRTR